ncbi:hypothetical protein DSO57_1021097 [Entomophthora muscae]|nr:hypothetical protein DSO57_1021097 [Entomophthora muscae]
MFLKFIQLNLTYAIVMFLMAIVLSIVNLTGDDKSITRDKGWNKIEMKIFTIAHVSKKKFLWAHVVAAWLSVIVLGYLLYQNNTFFVRLRQKHFLSQEYQSQLHTRTLLLTHLPRHLQSDQGISSFLDSLGLIYSPEFCTVGRRVGHLPLLIREYNMSIRQFETILAKASCSSTSNRPHHYIGRFGWLRIGQKVDSIDYFTSILKELYEEITELRTLARDGLPETQVGFAIYPDTASAHLVARQLSPGPGTYLHGLKPLPDVMLSPDPEDLIWSNLLLTRRQQLFRWTAFTAVFIVLLILGAFIFSYLATISSVSLLANKYSSVNRIFTNDTFNSLLDVTIPPMLMILAIFFVQMLLRRLSEKQSSTTHSSVERRLLAKFLAFLICDNLIIFSTYQALQSNISFGMLGQDNFQGFISSFKNFVSTLAVPFSNVIVQSSSFWVSQMCLRIISYLAELIQPITLLRNLQATARRRGSSWLPGLATTSRELRELQRPTRFAFPIGYAIQSFNLTLLLIFGIVAPLIVPFSVANFIIAYIVYKHQLMYVNQSAEEGRDAGGRLYATTFHSILLIWILSQFFLLFVLLLSNATNGQWYAILPLPFILSLFGLGHRSWFDAHLDFIDLDHHNAPGRTQRSPQQPTAQEVEMNYINPARRSTYRVSTQLSFSDQDSERDALTSPTHTSGGSTPASFVHHPALEQELLTLEFNDSLLNIFPELNHFLAMSSEQGTQLPSIHQLQSGQLAPPIQDKPNTTLTQTPHF